MPDRRVGELADFRISEDLEVRASKTDYPASVWQEVIDNWAYAQGIAGLAAGSVIVDVGAHVGLASIHFGRSVPDARVFAFEPAATSYHCLAENLGRHVPGAVAANLALGSSRGEADLTYYGNRSTMSSVHADDVEDRHNVRVLFEQIDLSEQTRAEYWDKFDRDVRVERVAMTTLSEALGDASIDEIGFLKIDVERAELEVLHGIADEHWAGLRRLAIEVHDRDGRLVEIGELLTRRGFNVRSFREKYFSGTDIHFVYAAKP
ncbi:FkbM family methyltransferase [Saccharopolyspora sp. NPDC002578]